MSDDARTRLLNDLDVKDLFERHADVRHVETLAFASTGIAVTVLLFLLSSMFQNTDPLEVKIARTAPLVFFVGWILCGIGFILYWRLTWLWERVSGAMARLEARNQLNSETSKLAFHLGLAAAIPPHRFLRMEGLAAFPIVVGCCAILYGVAAGLHPLLLAVKQAF